MVTINKKLSRRLSQKQIDVLTRFVEEKNEVPIRVVYTQEYWDKVAKDPNYQLANREIGALQDSLPKLAEHLKGKHINIIHLGVGNGVEIPFIVDALSESIISQYVIVDVNQAMLDLAEKELAGQNVKKVLRDIETDGIQDICDEAKNNGAMNLIFLIANGVLFSNDSFVEEIYKNLKQDDLFFLTLELYQENKDEEIIKPYLIPTVLDLLGNGLKIINQHPEYKNFSAKIDRKDNRLKVYYSTENGRKLLVLHSYKPLMSELAKRMKGLQFKTVFAEEYPDIHTAGCLYRK